MREADLVHYARVTKGGCLPDAKYEGIGALKYVVVLVSLIPSNSFHVARVVSGGGGGNIREMDGG
jgi:hypothetical protein